ncbi:MAG: DUF5011 domain-containing protein [Bacilli bacterium]|jgi:hypothetical protein
MFRKEKFGINKTYIDMSNKGNYYRPKKQSTDYSKYLALFILIFSAIIILWLGGFLETVDQEENYLNMKKEVCEKSIIYVQTKKEQQDKLPGKIIYITVKDLLKEGLLEEELIDQRTGKKIARDTHIRLEVNNEGEILCSGFAFPEDDRIPPVIELIGEETINIKLGTSFIDPGVYAVDNKDGDITNKIIRSGHLDVNKIGTYKIYYDVSDIAGNPAKQKQRIIIIN